VLLSEELAAKGGRLPFSTNALSALTSARTCSAMPGYSTTSAVVVAAVAACVVAAVVTFVVVAAVVAFVVTAVVVIVVDAVVADGAVSSVAAVVTAVAVSAVGSVGISVVKLAGSVSSSDAFVRVESIPEGSDGPAASVVSVRFDMKLRNVSAPDGVCAYTTPPINRRNIMTVVIATPRCPERKVRKLFVVIKNLTYI
jgi:hypothetical protein